MKAFLPLLQIVMFLLVKRNYLGLEVSRDSQEDINVIYRGEKDIVRFGGFISTEKAATLTDIEYGSMTCNGFRKTFNDQWQYLSPPLIEAAFFRKKVYALVKDGEFIVSEEKDAKVSSTENVVSLFKKD